MKLLLILFCAALSCAGAAENISFLPGGEIVFAKGPSEWTWKPSRWGMYDLVGSCPEQAVGEIRIGTNIFSSAQSLRRFCLPSTATVKVEARNFPCDFKLVPAPEGKPIVQKAAEPIVLNARDVTIHGVTLRYEPATNKLCVGYWVNTNDYPSWDFHVQSPGSYLVSISQGCGKGQGGSGTVVIAGKEQIPFTVFETGHFQNFTNVSPGMLHFTAAGTHSLAVKALRKAASAVMDIREVVLTKTTEP